MMKYLLVFLLWNTLALGAVKPMDRVRVYAGNHKVTVTIRNGTYWVEMEDSDIFGIGPTVNDAAEDFMMDVDLEANELGKPYLTLHPGEAATSFACPADNGVTPLQVAHLHEIPTVLTELEHKS